MSEVLFVAVGIALGVPFSWFALRLGRSTGLLDVPMGIKVHRRPIPYTGGAAIAATMLVAGIAFNLPRAFLVGALLMWLVGLVDDIRGLRPRTKIIAETVPLFVGASALELDPPVLIGAVAVGVFLVNAFNVIDGLDGLAAGVALLALLVMVGGGSAVVSAAAGLLVGSIVAFLAFNLHPARLFLGDQGSLLLGYFLWLLPVANYAAQWGPRALLVSALLWGFPLTNVAFVLTKRQLERRALLVGDRAHLYDVLNAKLGLRSTLLICWSVAAVSAVAAVLVQRA